jgi:hypothetical protein
MDQYYIDEGYYDEGYFVYIAIAAADNNSNFSLSCEVTVIGQTLEATADLTADFQFTATIGKLVVINSELVSESTQTALVGRILQAAAEFTSAFTPTLTADAFKNSTAILDVVADFLVDAAANRSANVLLEHIADLNAMAAKTVDVTSPMAASTTVTVSATLQAPASAELNSEFTVTAQGVFLKQTASALQTTSTVSVLSRILLRNTTVTVNSGTRFDPIIFDASVKKFGSHSAFFGDSTPDLFPTVTELGNTQIISNGTTFYIIKDDNTWTSNDGLSWSRTATNLTATIREVTYTNGQFIAFQSNSTVIWYSSDAITWSSSNTFPNTLSQRSGVVFFNGLYRVVGSYVSGTTYRIGVTSASSLTGSWTTGEIVNTNISSASTVQLTTRNHSNYIVWGYDAGAGSNVVVGRYSASSIGFNLYSSSPPGRRLLALDHDGVSSWSAVLSGTGISNYVRSTSNGGSTYNETTLANANGIDYANGRWFVRTSTEIRTNTVVHPLGSAVQLNTQSTNQIRATSSAWITWDPYRPANVLVSSNGSNWNTQEITNVSGVPANIVYSRGDNSDLSNFATVDFWLRTIHNDNKTLLTFQGQGSDPVIMRATNIIFSPGFSGFTALSTNTWHHVRISRSGSTTSTYLNGQRFANSTSTVWPTNAELRIGHSNGFYIDELLVSDQLLTDPSVTSFTVPSVPWVSDSNTDLLVHFDNSFADDSKFDPVAAAALAASFTVTAAIDGNLKIASAAVNSTVTVAATANKLVEGSASAESSSTVTVTATRVRSAASALSVDSALSVEVEVIAIIESSAELSSEFAHTTIVNRIRPASSALNCEFTQTATISHIEGADLLAFAESQVITDITVIRTTPVAVSASITQSATAVKVTDVNSELLTSVTQTTIAGFNKSAEIIISDAFTTDLTVEYFQGTSLIAPMTATMVVTANQTASISKTLTAVASVAIDARVNPQAPAANGQNPAFKEYIDVTVNYTYTYSRFNNDQTRRAFRFRSDADFFGSRLAANAFFDSSTSATNSAQGQASINVYVYGQSGSSDWYDEYTYNYSLGIVETTTVPTGQQFVNDSGQIRLVFDTNTTNYLTAYANGSSTPLPNVTLTGTTYNRRIFYPTFQPFNISNNNGRFGWPPVLFLKTITNIEHLDSYNTTAISNFNILATSPTIYYGPQEYAVADLIDINFATLEANAQLIVEGALISFTSNTSLAAEAKLIKGTSIPCLITAGLNIDADVIADGSCSATSAFNVTAQAVKTARTLTSVTAISSTSVSANRLRGVDSEFEITAEFTATAVKQTGNVIETTSTANISTLANRIRDFVPALESIATQLAAVSTNATGTVLLESQFVQSTAATKTTDQPIAVETLTEITAAVTKTTDVLADITATADITAQVDRIQATGSEMSSSSTVTANTEFSLIRNIDSDLNSTVTVAITALRQRNVSGAFESQVQLSCDNQVLRLAQADLESIVTTTFIVTKVVRIEADLQSNGFQVTVGDVINIDPFLQLKIAQETRTAKILPESRTLNIEQETRTLLIKGHP